MKINERELKTMLEMIERQYSADMFPGMIAGAYTLWLAQKVNAVDVADLGEFLEKNEEDKLLRDFLGRQLKSHWHEYRRYITAFPADMLQDVILTLKQNNPRFGIESGPEKLHKLVIDLLGIGNQDGVADFGAGSGDFLLKVHEMYPDSELWSDEISEKAQAITAIRAKFMDGKLTVVREDMFTAKPRKQFDKIFCFPPWGMRLRNMPSARAFLETQPPSLPLLRGTGSMEWVFALRMLSSLKQNGKAALFMPNGGTFNIPDTPIRKYFIERGMVEAVIELPSRILEYTNVDASIVIFSNDNTHIRMIDATELGTRGRRNTELTDNDIAQIVDALNGKECSIAKTVCRQDIILNGSILNPGRYVKKEIELEHAVDFGSIIREINRGAILTANALDELTSEEPTKYQYLTVSNIKNGIIDDELPYLSNVDKRTARAILQPNDLILSKIGLPFKVGVAPETLDRQIIANGNLFIIRLNENLADPYYIKAFLESAKGTELLQSIAVGTAMPNLSVEAIRNMKISLPSLEQQRKIAATYKAQMTEVISLQKKLSMAMEKWVHLLDDSEKE